jgi:hypothetical protein
MARWHGCRRAAASSGVTSASGNRRRGGGIAAQRGGSGGIKQASWRRQHQLKNIAGAIGAARQGRRQSDICLIVGGIGGGAALTAWRQRIAARHDISKRSIWRWRGVNGASRGGSGVASARQTA